MLPLLPLEAAERSPSFDIVEAVMQSTVRIEGTGSTGTGFVLQDDGYPPILVTAASVLQAVKAREVKLAMRTRLGEGWKYTVISLKLSEYLASEVDVAALPIQLPPHVLPDMRLTTEMIADDATMRSHGVRTGTEVMVVSYPLGLLSNEEGFGLLGSSRIGTFPLYPTLQHRAFALDRELRDCEYGAPVFVAADASSNEGETRRAGFLVGIIGKPWETTNKMRLTTVIPASLMATTIQAVKRGLDERAPSLPRSNRRPAAPADASADAAFQPASGPAPIRRQSP